jgi:tetratricopeptide (TPR) repeat protein
MKYADLYKHFTDELLNKDVIFAEKWLFTQRNELPYFSILEETLLKEGYIVDTVSLHIDRFLSSATEEHYQALLQHLQLIFNEEEICTILGNLSSQLPQFRNVQNDFLEKLLELGKFEEATHFMADGPIIPTAIHPEVLNKLIEQILSSPSSLHYEGLNSFLIPLAMSEPGKADKTIQKCISVLLREHDLVYVKDWLRPIRAAEPSLPILKKMDYMEQFSNNPDEQFALGELYFELMQYEKAIDCFSWEMELHSSDPRPVQWLAKIYKKLGNDSESEAYQHLLEKGAWFQEGVNH